MYYLKLMRFSIFVTGTYFGIPIQYLVPTVLVFTSRSATANIPGTQLYKSYFTHRICLIVPVFWTVFCIGLAIYYAVNKW